MVVAGRRLVTRCDAVAHEDRHELVVGEALIPGEDQERVLGRECRRAQDRRDVLRQPAVAGGDRAVVHVVAQVGSDPHVIGRGIR